MAKSYTNTTPLTSGPTRLQKILLGALCLLLISLALSVSTIFWKWLSDTPETPRTNPNPYGSLNELLDKSRLKQAYLIANGGTEMLNKIQTIRVSGWIEGEGTKQRFISLKKRPDKSLLTFKFEDYDLSFGVNGKNVWQRVTAQGQDPQIKLLEQKEAEAMIESAQFFGPVMRALLRGDGEVNNLEAATWEGQECIRVDITRAEQKASMQVYVDHLTMHALARTETFADGKVRKTIYKDYHKLAGMNEAFHVESYLDDVLQNRIIIESGNANSGILSKVFDTPQPTPDS